MATAATAQLGEAHAPKPASISAYKEFEAELKQLLKHERRDKEKHELPYFEPVRHLSDEELTAFTVDDFVQVRHAVVAYGHILFGKLRIPASKYCTYILPRWRRWRWLRVRAHLG